MNKSVGGGDRSASPLISILGSIFFPIDILSSKAKSTNHQNNLMVTTRDLQYYLFKLLGIRFDTCPVSGHSAHGQVERMIRTVQECLLEAGIDKVRLHATGVQTLCKLVESEINSIPLGYKYGRNAKNSSVLKIITPNVLRMGRVNTRAAAGPMRLPTGPSELIKKIEDAKNCGSRSGTPQLQAYGAGQVV